MMETSNLRGRVVVVSGAARGMGREYVEAFLNEGARVVAGDVSWLGDEEFFRSLQARDDALPLEMNVADDAQVEAAYAATLERFGTVDALVNNAAMRSRNLFPPTGRRRFSKRRIQTGNGCSTSTSSAR